VHLWVGEDLDGAAFSSAAVPSAERNADETLLHLVANVSHQCQLSRLIEDQHLIAGAHVAKPGARSSDLSSTTAFTWVCDPERSSARSRGQRTRRITVSARGLIVIDRPK